MFLVISFLELNLVIIVFRHIHSLTIYDCKILKML